MKEAAAIKRAALRLARKLTDIRRDLHMRPEVAFAEKRTAARVAEVLSGLGLEVRTGVGRTGVVGLLRGTKKGRTVALRADMDALPLDERNDVPYRSRHLGVMHACGHDGNTAMLLGAAMVLSGLRGRLRGNVKFLFQPAEETLGGAAAMIRDGALERPRPEAAFALHLSPEAPLGSVGARDGVMMAAPAGLRILIQGRGGHGALPHLTADPLVAANAIYQGFATLRRNIDPFEPFVLSVCAMNAGTTYNIVPDAAEIKATLRTLKKAVREEVLGRIRALLSASAKAYGVKCRLKIVSQCPALSNDPAMAAIVRSSAADLGLPVEEAEMRMGSEDFAEFLREAPGALFRLGVAKGKAHPALHSSRFDFDEAVLPLGAAMMACCAWTFLQERIL